MSDDARRGYTMFARLFLIVGAAFALLALLQASGAIHLFNGDPLGVALIVLIIGVLLEWTVRTAPPPGGAASEEVLGEDALGEGAVGEDVADEGASDDVPSDGRGAGERGNGERRVDEPAVAGRGVDPPARDRG